MYPHYRHDQFPVRSDSKQYLLQRNMTYPDLEDARMAVSRSFSPRHHVENSIPAEGEWTTQRSAQVALKAEVSLPRKKEETLLQPSIGENQGTTLIGHAQTVLPGSPSPHSSLTSSIYTGEADQLPVWVDSMVQSPISDIVDIIDQMLEAPLTPTATRLLGPNGRPLEVKVADNAIRRGEYSTGSPDQRYLPARLRTSLSSVSEEQPGLEVVEKEDIPEEEQEARTLPNILDGIDKIGLEYYEPMPRYPSRPILSVPKQNSWDISFSSAAAIKSIAGSIHHAQTFPPPPYPPPDKPLPALPVSAESNHSMRLRGDVTPRSLPPEQDSPAFRSGSRHTDRLDGCSKSQDPPPREKLLQLRLDTSHFAFVPDNVDPSAVNIHPLFREQLLDRPAPLRLSGAQRFREFTLPSPMPQHRRFLSSCSEHSMVSPSRPPSGTPSSYLRSATASPAPPSEIASDPGPCRSRPVRLSEVHPRGSLDEIGPNSPFLPKPYFTEDTLSKTAAQMYAEEIEELHELARTISLTDPILPLAISRDDTISSLGRSQAEMKMRDVRYPMKIKRSILTKLSKNQSESTEGTKTASITFGCEKNKAAVSSPTLSLFDETSKHATERSKISLIERQHGEIFRGVTEGPKFKTLKNRAQSVEKLFRGGSPSSGLKNLFGGARKGGA